MWIVASRTTVRDMAGDVRALGSLQRDALLGEITSPDIRKAHQQGVTIIAGTDTLGDAGSDRLTLPNLHRALELLVSLGGLSPAEALESATRDAAAVLGAHSNDGARS